jgi:hypothetical protein
MTKKYGNKVLYFFSIYTLRRAVPHPQHRRCCPSKGNAYSVFYRVSFRFHRDKSRRSQVAPTAHGDFAPV